MITAMSVIYIVFYSPQQMCYLHDRLCYGRSNSISSMHAYIPQRLHRGLAGEIIHMSFLYGTCRSSITIHILRSINWITTTDMEYKMIANRRHFSHWQANLSVTLQLLIGLDNWFHQEDARIQIPTSAFNWYFGEHILTSFSDQKLLVVWIIVFRILFTLVTFSFFTILYYQVSYTLNLCIFSMFIFSSI